MATWKNLKISDKVRILSVPKGDMEQRKREIAKGLDDAGWTVNIIELIIAKHPIVEIDQIDEYEQPWFACDLTVNGILETHTLAISEDESWELV